MLIRPIPATKCVVPRQTVPGGEPDRADSDQRMKARNVASHPKNFKITNANEGIPAVGELPDPLEPV